MKHIITLLALLGGICETPLIASPPSPALQTAPLPHPNIIIILADDMGWTLVEVDGAGWELLRPESDPLENQNLAAKHPEVVADLNARWMKWWQAESGQPGYTPESTKNGDHYKPQGDRGSGRPYIPSVMPAKLANRYPVP